MANSKLLNGNWQMANGKWQMANGKWQMANEKWQMANGKWQMANGNWQLANSKWSPPPSTNTADRPPLLLKQTVGEIMTQSKSGKACTTPSKFSVLDLAPLNVRLS